MTVIYAVKLVTSYPYFKSEDEIIGGSPDPVWAFKRGQALAASRPDFTCTMVQQEGGTGEWVPVAKADRRWIAEWALHTIERTLSKVPGRGWASCTCGWSTGGPGTSIASADFDERASEHIAVERQRAKDMAGRAVT